MIKILSCDGGGCRGLIPAIILMEIESRTKRRIGTMFQIMSGTSTGGLIVAGLAMPDKTNPSVPHYSAYDIVQMYEREGAKIFSNSTLNKLRKLRPLRRPKYSPDNIEDVLRRYFGNTRLSQSITNVLISSYEIERRTPFFFKSSKAKLDPTEDFYLRDIARATSAAPTYFPPHNIDDKFYLIDGAMASVNNPALCAYVESCKLFKGDSEVLVVSLGTGTLTKPYRFKEARSWGIAKWGLPALSILLDGSSATVDYQMRQLLPPEKYFRLQGTLTPGSEALDNTSPKNMEALKQIALKVIEDNNNQIDQLCNLLSR